jgi:hypothetical protein
MYVWNVESIGIRITHVGGSCSLKTCFTRQKMPAREIIHSHIYSRSSVELQSKPCWLGFSSFEYQSAEHKSRDGNREIVDKIRLTPVENLPKQMMRTD